MTKILVTYASKHHSTAEIANAIAEAIRQSDGVTVDIQPVETVKELTPYEAVVLGSAVYAGQWQSEAVRFLEKNETELAKRAVWLFSSGPTGEGEPTELMKGWRFPAALQPIADRIHPRDVIVFHGNLDPARLNVVERVIVKGVHAPMGDFRDWNIIREWGNRIAQALESKSIPS